MKHYNIICTLFLFSLMGRIGLCQDFYYKQYTQIKGRLESSKIAHKNVEQQTSSGIKTTIERIDLLNFGKKEKLNSVEILDPFDDEGNALGIKTILKLNILSK